MPRRRVKTAADFMVIGLTPALIMMFIASFVFFVLTVFYNGAHETRLCFIFAMVVMATVCIARLSMEEGIEYAALFAFPLAIVSMIAMMRFVEFKQGWGLLNFIANVGLLCIVWFSAHKLTWNCTLFDEEEDASGEGLLQAMGVDDEVLVEDQEAEANDDTRPEDSADTRGAEKSAEAGESENWWLALVRRQRKKHPPGVSVIFFALFGLPLFGLGQWFLPPDPPVRRWSFQLLFVFVASGLGLLLTTAFLGLRRYLRQRRVEMPTEMAGVWLAVGGVVILAFLVLCMVLPRPGAAVVDIAPPFSFGSPEHDRPNRFGFGNDGPRDDEQGQTTRVEKESGSGAPEKSGSGSAPGSGPKGQANGKGGQQGGKQAGKNSPSQGQQEGKSGKQPAGGKQSGGSQSGGKQSGGKQSGGKQSGGQQSGQQSGGKQSGGKESGGKQSSGKQSGQGGEQHGERSSGKQGESGEDPSRGGKQGSEGSKSGDRRSGDESRQKEPGGGESGDRGKDDRGKASSTAPRFESSNSSRSRSNSSNSSQSRRSASPPRSADSTLSKVGSGLAWLLKMVFYLVLAIVAGWLIWRYRRELAEGWQKLRDDLLRFWEKLFGGKPSSPAANLPDVPTAPAPEPFSAYVDPFASGQAGRMQPVELVRYSFEAVEAWAREHGLPRDPEQTPLEFTLRLRNRAPRLGRELVLLANLYGQAAYAARTVTSDQARQLKTLWQGLGKT